MSDTITSRFTIDTNPEPDGYRTSAAYLSGRDHHLETAQRWVLNLRVDNGDDTWVSPEAVVALLVRVNQIGCEAMEGHATGGDSFFEFHEAYTPEHDHQGVHLGRRLGMYFVAPNPDTAQRIAQEVCIRLGGEFLSDNYSHVNTAGDGGEIIEVWSGRRWHG